MSNLFCNIFFISVKTFRMPDTKEISKQVNFSCTYDDQSKTSSWIMKYNGSEFLEVPECLYYCGGSPVSNNTKLVENNWDGEHWSDSYPIFSCINGKTFIYDTNNYHKI